MAGVRIRWRGVARVAAVVLVALIALRLLPGLLRAPEPPPLGADVGLPRATPVRASRSRRSCEGADEAPSTEDPASPRENPAHARPDEPRQAP